MLTISLSFSLSFPLSLSLSLSHTHTHTASRCTTKIPSQKNKKNKKNVAAAESGAFAHAISSKARWEERGEKEHWEESEEGGGGGHALGGGGGAGGEDSLIDGVLERGGMGVGKGEGVWVEMYQLSMIDSVALWLGREGERERRRGGVGGVRLVFSFWYCGCPSVWGGDHALGGRRSAWQEVVLGGDCHCGCSVYEGSDVC
jgi:hypothetical protein